MTDDTHFINLLDDVLESGALEPFCANPILLPGEIGDLESSDWVSGLGSALGKMMAHVGLEDVRIELAAFTIDPTSNDAMDAYGVVPEDQPFEPVGGGALVEYAGVESETATFVFDHRCTASVDRMLCAASMAVTEAFREAHTGVELDEQDEENEIWATCLGFGILLTNGSHVVETWSESGASLTRSTRLGHFGPPEHARLLAMKVAAMRLGEETTKEIRSALRPNARKPFEEMLEEDDLLEAVDLPERSRWQRSALAVPVRSDIDRRVVVTRTVAAHRAAIERATSRVNEGRPVFRVPRSNVVLDLYIWGIMGLLVGAILAVSMGAAWGVVGVFFPAFPILRNRLSPDYVCSNRGCVNLLDDSATVCPECGGSLVGTLGSADERLAAEERWLEENPDARQIESPDSFAEPRPDDSDLYAASQGRDFGAIRPGYDVIVARAPDDASPVEFHSSGGHVAYFVFSAPSRFEEWNIDREFESETVTWSEMLERARTSGLAIVVNPATDPVVIPAFEVAGIV